VWTAYDSWEQVARAIADMEVRGAPAIGCAGAFAAALAARHESAPSKLRLILRRIADARPTAVNLSAALHRMANAITSGEDVVTAANAIWLDDLTACRAIGAHGAALLPDEGTVLTHCNAGALATAGYGTALGAIRAAVAAGKKLRVLCDETRPFMQGARLTAWELQRDGIACEVIVDSAAAYYLASGEIAAVIVGADRIARNGDCANKIGTLSVAASCSVFGVPFFVAAPRTTVDVDRRTGADIPIETRAADEVRVLGNRTVVPAGVPVRNPVFDVTPARLVTAIVTDRGVFRAPYDLGA
jgi:methylthioribose-1-phosphate isomerase